MILNRRCLRIARSAQIDTVLKPKLKNLLRMCQNKKTLNDTVDIAECFSEYFFDIPKSSHERIQPVNNSPLQ